MGRKKTSRQTNASRIICKRKNMLNNDKKKLQKETSKLFKEQAKESMIDWAFKHKKLSNFTEKLQMNHIYAHFLNE